MSEHTPGPWRVGGEWPQIFAIYDQRCIYIANVETGVGRDWIDGKNPLGRDVGKANAKLMAAAPELADALEKLYAMYFYESFIACRTPPHRGPGVSDAENELAKKSADWNAWDNAAAALRSAGRLP